MNWSKDNLHHTYICIGEPTSIVGKLVSFIENDFGVKTTGNPDVFISSYEGFGIDDARLIQSSQLQKPVMGENKFYIISFSSVTHEAQNSLLKILEEPTKDTHFFIVSHSANIFLPTLVSRAQIEFFSKPSIDEEIVKSFLSSLPNERLDFIKDIVDTKDRGSAIELLEGILQFLRKQEGYKLNAKYSKDVSSMYKYINDRGASIKMIMEYVSLVLPRFMI